MADYNTLKVAELHAELQQRGVAFEKKHKKADLVKLLQDHDAAHKTDEPSTDVAPVQLAEPVATDSAPVDANSEQTAPEPVTDAPITDNSVDGTPSAADLEIEKRKARAAKFGVAYVEPAAPATKPAKLKPTPASNGTKPSVPVTAPVPAEDPEVLARRRAKFGLPVADAQVQSPASVPTASTPSVTAPIDPLVAERARIDEEKRKAREERFKVQPAGESTSGVKRQSSVPLDREEPAEKKTKA